MLDAAGLTRWKQAVDFFAKLWRVARITADPGDGLWSGVTALLATYATLLAIIAATILTRFGFDFTAVLGWVESQGGWAEAIALAAFKAFLALVFALCCVVVLGATVDYRNPDRPGWFMAMAAVLIGWFAGGALFAGLVR